MHPELIRLNDDRNARRAATGTLILAKGVRSPTTSVSHALAAEAALLASDRTAVVCDLSAALIWGLPVPAGFGLDADSQAVAVATSHRGSRHRSAGVRGRRLHLPEMHVTLLQGVRLTTPART